MIGPTFELEALEGGPVQHLVVRGEIDIKTAPALEAALAEPRDEVLLVDVSQVEFIDSTGLRVLAAARMQFESDGRRLVLCAPPDSAIVRTMRLAGLVDDFHVISDPSDMPE